jgi:tRNA pseudouridine32 synthase/23S rRNA pseudouridine746 synthase
VALKSLGSPVLGDPVYYRSSLEREDADRCYLHAYALRFRIDDRLLSYSCNPHRGSVFADSDFLQALARFKTPWNLSWPQRKR